MNSRERVQKALNHEEPDRVPISDFFSTQFKNQWLEQNELGENADIYQYYDLDLVVIGPNMDPKIREPVVIKKNNKEIIFKSGWDSVVKFSLSKNAPMPGYLEYPIKKPDDYLTFEFEDPSDPRRYQERQTDLLSIEDNPSTIFSNGLPSFMETAKVYKKDFCLFGSVCEPNEVLTRARGMKGHFRDIILQPRKLRTFAQRATDFMIEIGEQQLRRVPELAGIVIWGDIAYSKGMFYAPSQWRDIYLPCIEQMVEAFKQYNVKIVYHSDGDFRAIFDDLISAGVDAINPVESKAGLNVSNLATEYERMAFFGGIDVQVLINGTKKDIRKEILNKLYAAKGGGYIVASDSGGITGDISPENYEYMLNLVRKWGTYPLNLKEFAKVANSY